jgi:hypothetical protein
MSGRSDRSAYCLTCGGNHMAADEGTCEGRYRDGPPRVTPSRRPLFAPMRAILRAEPEALGGSRLSQVHACFGRRAKVEKRTIRRPLTQGRAVSAPRNGHCTRNPTETSQLRNGLAAKSPQSSDVTSPSHHLARENAANPDHING